MDAVAPIPECADCGRAWLLVFAGRKEEDRLAGDRAQESKERQMAGKTLARKATRLLIVVVAMAVLTGQAAASTSLKLNGSFSIAIIKPDFTGLNCTIGALHGDQCGVIQIAGLGAADFVYEFGPAFDPIDKNHFAIDGTFTIILQSDGSTISGPLTGVFYAPSLPGAPGRQHSYGNPNSENDSVAFAGGTGQFAGLHGTANYQQFLAGARYRGTLTGTLVSD